MNKAHFILREHDRSLAGSLAKYVKKTLPTNDALGKARKAAWRQAAKK